MSQPWDYIAKLVCIGDSGTGKSSLTIRLCEGRFSAQHDVTIGVEFGSRIVPVGPPASVASSAAIATATTTTSTQKHMKLSLWDTAGQETYRSVTRSYFRGASGALLVFDIMRQSSFVSIAGWLVDLRQIAEPGIVIVLVGNKTDLTTSGKKGAREREVSQAEASAWAKENDLLDYVETSAKSGEGVEKAFCAVAEKIYRNIEEGKYDLNDRRSGVKGPGAGGRGGGVRLGMNDASRAAGGGCC